MTLELLVNLLINCKHQYNEGISTVSHSFQAARLAKQAGAKRTVVLAALFHDIGHMFSIDDTDGCGAADHASTGAIVLRRFGLGETVCRLVAEHANAKRYLVSVDKEYESRLSPASKRTLQAQGGPMKEAEQHAFEQHPLFRDILALRRFDEAAKNKITEPTRKDILLLIAQSKL